MQTFLPQLNIPKSMRILDSKRLGKQRVEAYQILQTLRGESSGWANHPAIKMWRGYETALTFYMNAAIKEWKSRGYRNTMIEVLTPATFPMPTWFGNDLFHASHRSNLLRKDPIYYGKFGWKEQNDLPYVWPTNGIIK